MTIEPILGSLRTGLETLYGPRLKGVYLFGSYARGRQDSESDIDLLIVLDRVERYADEIDRTGPLISALSLDAGVSISRVIVSDAAWNASESGFLASVREDAVTV
jgi:predicted nucleotidyltransferase